jgi:hypothetical protein
MKHRFLAFAALGIGLLLAVATKAEGIRTAMEAANTQFDEIYNKGDAKAVAALYTPRRPGSVTGQDRERHCGNQPPLG